MYDLRCPPFTYHCFLQLTSLPGSVRTCSLHLPGRFPLKAPTLVPPHCTLPSPPSLSCHQPCFGVHSRRQPQVAGGPGGPREACFTWKESTEMVCRHHVKRRRSPLLHTNLCNACIVDVDAHGFCFFFFNSEGSGNLWCIFFYFPVTVLFVFLSSPFPYPCLFKDP